MKPAKMKPREKIIWDKHYALGKANVATAEARTPLEKHHAECREEQLAENAALELERICKVDPHMRTHYESLADQAMCEGEQDARKKKGRDDR